MRTQPWVTTIAAVYAVLALVWVGLHRLWPFAILRINEALKVLPKARLPGWLGGIEVSLPNLILVGFFHYGDRELDAWVAKSVDQARKDFEASTVVRRCADQADLPVVLDGERLPNLGAEHLRPLFRRTKSRLLIWGDAEKAKINLVCRVARWGMDPDRAKRLRPNLMLPVLLDGDFAHTPGKDTDPFTETVREKLLSGEAAASQELVLQLLRRQRILAIIVGLSDLDDETRSSVRPADPDFPANALVRRHSAGWAAARLR
jgi:hypothetical protein